MKQGWKIMKLGDLCSFERGLTYSKGDEADLSTKGVLRSNNVDLASNTLNFGEIKYLKEDIDIPVSKKVKRNSLLMCMSNGSKAHLGKVAIIEDDLDYAFGGFMGLLIPNEEIVFPRYFYYALITPMYKLYIKGLSDGANINNLKFADLKEFDIPVPTISEQQRIVALLDAEFAKIDALKANAEKNLQNAKDLFQAALNKLIIGGSKGWKSTKLKTICSKIGSGATPLGGKSAYGKEGVSLIRSLNVHNNEFHYEDLAHINEEQAKQLSNVEIKEDDVLFNITGASVTRCCKVPKNVLPARVNQHVSILRLLPNTLLPNFLVYTMISPYHNSALMKMAENGATRQAITKKQLEEWVIEYPDTIADQQSIVSRLDTLNEKCKALQANYEKTLSLCDDLKQALLRKAFNGEI